MIEDFTTKEKLRDLVGKMDEMKRLIRTQPVIQFRAIQILNDMNRAVNDLVTRLKEMRA